MQTGFLWILLSLVLYGLIHSILASHHIKDLFKAWWGDQRYQRFYRLFFSLQAAVLFAPVLLLVAILPDQTIYSIPKPWDYLTSLVQLLAVVALIHSVMLTGALRFTGLLQAMNPEQAKKPIDLVTRGLYRWVRHPLYICTFLFIWLTSRMSWNVLAMNIGITVYTLIGAILEERKLISEFGESYEEYRRKTPFIIPGSRISK